MVDIKNEIKTEIKNINNLIQNQKKETNDSISKHKKSIQILFNNSKIFDDSIKKINKDITSIKQAQEELKEENENILERIENIENNEVDTKNTLEKIGEENSITIETIQKIEGENLNSKDNIKILLEENEEMKKEILELSKKYNLLNGNISEIKKETCAPKDFIYLETISEDLSCNNYYNTRACLFVSNTDDKVYVAYGESSLNLEGYDVIDAEKFTITIKNIFFLNQF